ncbi:SH3 domain-containing protein [Lyophyllum atratum]|nr:SH3 domain-containing protein [Lyophyllum atratum]
MSQTPENAALLAHIISQLESNVHFLVSQNLLSHSDATTFLAKLPDSNGTAKASPSLVTRLKGAVISPPPAPARPATATQAKALWAYNEDGRDGDDLSFAAGDIIEIIEETNADWWTGKAHGRQALFPSTYVEKIAPGAAVTATPAPAKTAYRPFGASHHGQEGAGGVNSKKGKFGKYKDTMAHSAAGGVGFGAGAAIGGGLVRAIF